MKVAFLIGSLLIATAASAQTTPYYGQPSATFGAPLPDVTNNVGVRTFRFDNREHGLLTTYQRRALKRARAAAKAAPAFATSPAL